MKHILHLKHSLALAALAIFMLMPGLGQGQTTYSWIGADNGAWTLSTNWTPERTTPAITDILQFNDATIKTVTAVPAQTIGQLLFSNNTKVNLQSAAAVTLIIAGSAGMDLDIPVGSALNLNVANAITINLLTGVTGSISGTMAFSSTVSTAHRLTAADAYGITFNSGATFTAGTNFTGSAFGTVNLNSIIFAEESTYIAQAGGNPFGATQPNSVVVFQSGSLYKVTGGILLSFSGRTYANFEYNKSGSTSPFGASACVMDNLTITSGILNFNMTGTPGHSIKGNISVAAGATLNFAPASVGTVNLNGSEVQIISGAGTITCSSYSTLAVNNSSGVELNANASIANLTINSGTFVVAQGSQLTVNGTLTNLAGNTGLVIESGCSLIQTSGGVSATVRREIAAWGIIPNHGWHLLSSPVAAQAIISAFTAIPAVDYDFYQWRELDNTWLNQKDVSNNIVNFVLGTGYLVAYKYTETKHFTGTLNATDVLCSDLTLSAGVNRGWNLLGNPFPSAIKWNDGTNWTVPTTFAATAKVWDEGDAAYNEISSNGLIPAMNGFMVEVLSGSPASLTIPIAARVHDATDTWYKSSAGMLKLKAHDLDNSTAQETIIRVDENATEGYDAQYDSHFLAGFAPKFYSTVGGEQLSTNSLPAIDNSRVIPMGFVKNAAGNFSIELVENSLMGVSTIYLTDNKTGSITNMSTSPVYNFTSVAGDDANRFLLSFQGTASIANPDITKDFTVHAENGVITILQTGNLTGNVTVTDMAGRILATASLMAGSPTSINLQGHPGVYVVSIVTTIGVSNVKVIIN